MRNKKEKQRNGTEPRGRTNARLAWAGASRLTHQLPPLYPQLPLPLPKLLPLPLDLRAGPPSQVDLDSSRKVLQQKGAAMDGRASASCAGRRHDMQIPWGTHTHTQTHET